MQITKNMEIEFKKLGEHIKGIREEKGISIEELSEKTGIRKEYLKKIESGNAYGVMINKHLLKIAKAINVEIYELFGYK